MELIIILLIIAFLVFIIIRGIKGLNSHKKHGFKRSEIVSNVLYTCGHPSIDKPTLVSIGVKNNILSIMPVYGKNSFDIPNEKIKNITIEDTTTIQRRPTVLRFLALGILAFAWQKKEKIEQAYMVLEWNDGRFDHDTIFEYKGAGAMMSANKDRNKLIQKLQYS